jgi:hypothetical protein
MHKSLILLSIIFYLLFLSCGSQEVFKQEGFIQLRFRNYDSTERTYIKEAFMTDRNIWYKGKIVIEEVRIIKDTDSNGVLIREKPVAYYLFIDRGSKSFYNYSSFSDTARILDKYTQADTAEIRGLGGWSFYKDHDMNIVDSMLFLPDTIINNIAYKRNQVFFKASNKLRPGIIYLRCDKKGTKFIFDKKLSEKLGCPILRIDYLPTFENPSPVSSEILFIRDSLTVAEIKVFNAWEKNIKKYPVNN